MHDLHLAFRFLSKDRSFSLLAVLVLALGIGAVATQFSVVNGMLLRPPAYPHAERLVSISMVDTQRNLSLGGASLPDFVAWRDTQQSFAEFAAYAARLSINVTHQDTPRRYNGVYVTHDFFRTLGVTPALGRDFTADDDREGAAKTIIVSHAVWQTDFGGAADVIGRSVRINGRPGTIVGVMPAGFSFPLNEQVWAPFFAEFPLRPRGDAQVGGGAVLGRLKPHATPAQAAAELTASAQVFAKEWPATNQHLTAVEVRPFTETFFGPQIRQVLFLMLGAVAVVFLIACVNVMNMQFARATRRMRDLAVCSALGASRGRLLRQMLLESLVLALAGGTAGLLFATWATDALLRQARTLRAPPPSWVTFDLDGRVVAVLIAVTVGAAVLSGIVPAWFAARGRPLDMLRDGGRGGPGRRVNVIIRALVVLQIALTAALLIVSSFMVRSIVNQQRIDRGYDTGAVLTARMTLFQADYPSNDALVRFYDRVLTALRSDPQFTHAALTTRFRLAISNTSPCEIEGETYLNEQSRPESAFETISDGYFSALGLRLLEGRDFSATDDLDHPPVAIVNAAFARRHFGRESPLGRRVRVLQPNNPPGPWLTIVGVAPDTHMQNPSDSRSDGAGIFRPLTQAPQRWITIAVRGHAVDPTALAEPLRQAMARTEKDLPIYLVNTAAFVIDETLAQNRLLTLLFLIFGGVAMLLAAVGLYGMMSFAVGQRTHEFGIRMALGASTGRIVTDILRQGAAQLALGLTLGLLLAAALVSSGQAFLQEFLYKVAATDPWVWGSTTALLTAVALAACLIPARRATKVDPMIALRAE